jgi:hypothetical protein
MVHLIAEKVATYARRHAAARCAYVKRKNEGSQDGSFPASHRPAIVLDGCQILFALLCYLFGYSLFRLLLPNLVLCSFIHPFNLLNLLQNSLGPRRSERIDRNDHHK